MMLARINRGGIAFANGNAGVMLNAVRRISSAKFNEDYILPKSKIPTFHFQKSLPRLKIPELPKTLERYLNAIEPLLDPKDFENTKRKVEDFQNTEGPKLQEMLLAHDKANKHTSFISAPWYEMYLQDRAPLPLNYNPQITLNDNVNPEKNKQAERAASLVTAALRFHHSLKEEVLYPDIFHTKPEKSKTTRFDRITSALPQSLAFYGAYLFGAYPLDMSQYGRLFSSTRVPKRGMDVLEGYKSSEHVIVIRNNHFYKLPVRNARGQFLSESQILGGINQILADNSPRADKDAIGILSTENRDTWADSRTELHATNQQSLEAIDSALFVLSLDEEANLDDSKLSRLFLFGDGKNRWFDKSFSLLVTKDGKAAINFEHSWGDGVAVVRVLDEIYNSSNLAPAVKPSTDILAPTKLTWNLTPKILQGIEKATKRFNDDTNAMKLTVMTTNVVKRQQIKDFKVSPDGFMQMSFQLAYHKLYNKTATTYESASTAAFKHGRTEAIRSASKKSVIFTKTFANKSASLAEKANALKEAISYHQKISIDALSGNGFDRHLFGLRYIAQKNGLPVSEIFKDKAYQVLNTNILSTSTLASPAIVLGAFGPVAKEGYGIGYGMDENNLRFNITSYLEVAPFANALQESLVEMTKALSETGSAKKK
jgi:carnitine O-palmitoyltransferase 2